MNRISRHVILSVAIAVPSFCNAQVLTFENVAPAGSLVSPTPANPYFESGFRITPAGANVAVFDSAAGPQMVGNSSDWFGFSETNSLSLTPAAGAGPFDIGSLLIGPSTLASNPAINMTITGNLFGGGVTSSTFTGIATATSVTLNWTGVASVVFTTSDDAGLDNINVNPLPEPSAQLLVGLAMLSIGGCGRTVKSGQVGSA